MADLTFDEAVKVVKRLILPVSQVGGHNLIDYAVNYYVLQTPATRRVLLVDKWILGSKGDRETWESVNRIAQWHLRSGVTMPRELAEWIADRLEGIRRRPANPGPPPGANAPRDTMIASVVQELVDRGFRGTRNSTRGEGASAEGGSACDVLGYALGMNYKAVERVWTKSTPSQRELLRSSLKGLFARFYETRRNN